MRNNQPVTQREYVLKDDHFLISRTDLKGRVTYANPAFVEVSGFERDELVGAPHNLVRHPDMPPAAFQDLWDTLAAGETWQGLVKNRRKNGDHYWVDASVSPIVEEGEIVGHASMRTKPERAEVELAEAVYARMREGHKTGYTLNRGRLERRGLVGRLGRLNLRSMRAKVVAMVLVAGVLLAMAGGLGLFGIDAAGQRLEALDRDGLQDVARLQQIDQVVTKSHQALTSREPFELINQRDEVVASLEQAETRLETLWSAYRDRELNQGEAATAFGERLDEYRQAGLEHALELLNAEDNFKVFSELPPHAEQMRDWGNALSDSVNALITAKQEAATALADQARTAEQRMMLGLAVMLGLGLLVLVVLGLIQLRALVRPLREAERFTLQIASGNLAASAPTRRRDEVGRMLGALELMRKSLGSIVGNVNDGVERVAPAARDIATGNEELASRTEQQAASLQQTASSMEEMTTTVQHNSDNARQASGLASDNATRTGETGELMQQLVGTMGEITDGSKKMTEIIDVIDSIAFQTNILALNASVEAARAGEQGRGFAVVAGEVRQLASRSASAAQEIKALIDGSARQIEGGAELVKRAETSLAEVLEASTRVNDIMGEITAASDEQSNGIGQINQAVMEMDRVTQQNAARVQSSAQAATELDQQATELAHAVAAFRLRGAGMERAPSLAQRRGGESRQPLPAASDQPRDASAAPPVTRAAPVSDPAVEEWEEF
ncbi:methyl-accepting chemotaxis protein [Halomonas organivorans]|uniref:Methyl-accepting chemotaxis protein/aerotaxis receptor n=1 Tax=Halomonas organivorans TaxID=257772 RepID=A0A7W5G4X2_9GAMM|nr:methyl-accepting chemotaxis protein [Halomonas organivorans]MBB3140402.1 methyl-accepting chemotaxis protein/aerotaxis receptor [Halomonas organivorans]